MTTSGNTQFSCLAPAENHEGEAYVSFDLMDSILKTRLIRIKTQPACVEESLLLRACQKACTCERWKDMTGSSDKLVVLVRSRREAENLVRNPYWIELELTGDIKVTCSWHPPFEHSEFDVGTGQVTIIDTDLSKYATKQLASDERLQSPSEASHGTEQPRGSPSRGPTETPMPSPDRLPPLDSGETVESVSGENVEIACTSPTDLNLQLLAFSTTAVPEIGQAKQQQYGYCLFKQQDKAESVEFDLHINTNERVHVCILITYMPRALPSSHYVINRVLKCGQNVVRFCAALLTGGSFKIYLLDSQESGTLLMSQCREIHYFSPTSLDKWGCKARGRLSELQAPLGLMKLIGSDKIHVDSGTWQPASYTDWVHQKDLRLGLAPPRNLGVSDASHELTPSRHSSRAGNCPYSPQFPPHAIQSSTGPPNPPQPPHYRGSFTVHEQQTTRSLKQTKSKTVGNPHALKSLSNLEAVRNHGKHERGLSISPSNSTTQTRSPQSSRLSPAEVSVHDPNRVALSSLTLQQVTRLLIKNNLRMYTEKFTEQGVDGLVLRSCIRSGTPEIAIKQLGMELIGHYVKLTDLLKGYAAHGVPHDMIAEPSAE